MSMKWLSLVAIAGVCIAAPAVHADMPLSFSMEVQPVYDFVVFDSPDPFDLVPPGVSQVIIPFNPSGPMGVEVSSDLNDPAKTSADVSTITGEFAGDFGGIPYTLRIFQFNEGGLSNIVRDSGGDLISADLTMTAVFEQILEFSKLDPGLQDVRLFGDPMTFTGAVDGIPFAYGTSLTSPTPRGLYLDNGDGSYVQIGAVQDRFLNVVPEPASQCLLVLGALGGAIGLGRKQRLG